jgi:hypothetical protein
MREDDLAELAERIALAWARGSGRSEKQGQMAVASIITALREAHDHGHGRARAGAEKPGQNTVVRLACCPDCDTILRDPLALIRHSRFCPAGSRNALKRGQKSG